MGFFEYIERLQKKPEAHRRKVAFGASATITAVIALVWVSSLTSGFGLADRESSSNSSRQNLEQSASSFSSIQSDVSNTVDGFRDQWENLKDSSDEEPTSSISSVEETTPLVDRSQATGTTEVLIATTTATTSSSTEPTSGATTSSSTQTH